MPFLDLLRRRRAEEPVPEPVPEEERVVLARQLRQRYPEIQLSLELADWILQRERLHLRGLRAALRLYGHHLMNCNAWGPGPAGRRCTCGLGILLKEDP